MTEFDKLRLSAETDNIGGGWREELRQYLAVMPKGLTPETDVVEWWSVHHFQFYLPIFHIDAIITDTRVP
jgi:hypothetical protein